MQVVVENPYLILTIKAFNSLQNNHALALPTWRAPASLATRRTEREAVLEGHPEDRHHGQPAVRDLRNPLLFSPGGGQHLEAVVAWQADVGAGPLEMVAKPFGVSANFNFEGGGG